MEKYLLSRTEAAARYGLSVRGLEKLYTQEPSFPLIKLGSRVLIPMPDADAWFAAKIRAEAMTS